MSTIATPRDPNAPLARRVAPSSSQAPPINITPTSSARPSLDAPRPATGSPVPAPSGIAPAAAAHSKRANRAALREYYNLRRGASPAPAPAGGTGTGTGTPTLEITDPTDQQAAALGLGLGGLGGSINSSVSSHYHNSEVAPSELDAPGFDAAAWTVHALETSTLAELLRTHTRVLGEMRALDAEKKALVYDNYSKLISATETIRRMRASMEQQQQQQQKQQQGGITMVGAGGSTDVMASTLDLVIRQVFEQASKLKEKLRREVGEVPLMVTLEMEEAGDGELDGGKRRTRELAAEIIAVPERLRALVQEGKAEEARREWEIPRRLLERWKEKGMGGQDVDLLIQEGDAALVAPEAS